MNAVAMVAHCMYHQSRRFPVCRECGTDVYVPTTWAPKTSWCTRCAAVQEMDPPPECPLCSG